MTESFGYMGEALLLAVIFVYLVLAAQFESFIDPLAIMLSLPLSIVGMAGMLFLTGDTINIMSLIGLILLMGLVTKNAILLVDYAKILQARRDGADGGGDHRGTDPAAAHHDDHAGDDLRDAAAGAGARGGRGDAGADGPRRHRGADHLHAAHAPGGPGGLHAVRRFRGLGAEEVGGEAGARRPRGSCWSCAPARPPSRRPPRPRAKPPASRRSRSTRRSGRRWRATGRSARRWSSGTAPPAGTSRSARRPSRSSPARRGRSGSSDGSMAIYPRGGDQRPAGRRAGAVAASVRRRRGVGGDPGGEVRPGLRGGPDPVRAAQRPPRGARGVPRRAPGQGAFPHRAAEPRPEGEAPRRGAEEIPRRDRHGLRRPRGGGRPAERPAGGPAHGEPDPDLPGAAALPHRQGRSGSGRAGGPVGLRRGIPRSRKIAVRRAREPSRALRSPASAGARLASS